MRLLFGLLLVLSLGFFAFMQWGGQLTGASKNGQAMIDLNADKIRLLAMPPAKMIPGSAVQPLSQPLVVSAPLATSAPSAVAELLISSAPAAASAPLVTAASAPIAASAPAPVSVPAKLPARVSAPVKQRVASSCMEWGEFSGTDLKQATQALAGMKLGDRLGRRIVEYDIGYWVSIQPLKGQAAVKRKIEQLKALGVEDYFVVQMPGHKVSAISLGVFKTREAAEHYLRSLSKKGVRTARVGVRKSKLKFTVFTLKHIDAEQVAHLEKLQKELENSELNSVPCK